MREVKFRAWDKTRSKFSTSGNLMLDMRGWKWWQFADTAEPITEQSNFELMQYTGLKDKNGVEIYEGDIIEKPMLSRPFSKSAKECQAKFVVEWDEQKHPDNDHNNGILAKNPSAFNARPGFYGREIWNEKGYGNHSWSEFANCEVIGNIYENPELLK